MSIHLRAAEAIAAPLLSLDEFATAVGRAVRAGATLLVKDHGYTIIAKLPGRSFYLARQFCAERDGIDGQWTIPLAGIESELSR